MVIGKMLKEGMDVYVPLVDDHAVDAIVKRSNGTIAQIQIKARSATCSANDAALFAAIPHPEERHDYWFVFYSERMEKTWILSSAELLTESTQNKSGKNIGLRSIWFNGRRKNPQMSSHEEYCKTRYEKYLAEDFSRIRDFTN